MDIYNYISKVNDILNGIEVKDKITSLKEIKKIYSKYSNKEVKEKNKFLIDIFIKKSTKLMGLIKKNYNLLIDHEKMCLNYFDKNGYRKLLKGDNGSFSYFFNDDNRINEIKNNHTEIMDLEISTYSIIMDIYFLRRFCDKDYITNAIFYGGAAHGVKYINFLIHFYNFKITHASYHLHPIKDINEMLKNKYYEYEDNANLFLPPVLIQCSNIYQMPKQFN